MNSEARLRRMILLVAALAGSAAYAEEAVQLRYGLLTARAGADPARFGLYLDGHRIADTRAEAVTLYRIAPAGAAEHVVVDAVQAGLHCRHRYFIVTLHAGGRARRSPLFGQCQELQSAASRRDGAEVVLRSHGASPATQTFVWKQGQLRLRAAPRNAR